MISVNHRYPWFVRLSTYIFNYLGFAAPILILLIPFISPLFADKPLNFYEIIDFLLLAIFSWVFPVLRANFHPEITSDLEGLHIKFLWSDLNVLWEDVIDIKPLFNLRFIKTEWVIRTRSLTPFHRLYGLLYSFSFHPCLIVSKGISNFDELERRVNLATRKNRGDIIAPSYF